MKVLFVTVDGGGNVPPQLGVARALRTRGAEVVFLGHPGLRERVEQAGFAFEQFSTGRNFDPLQRRSQLRMIRDFSNVMIDRGIGFDAIAVARRERVDLVVADTIVAGGIERLLAAGVPTVTLVHCFYGAMQDMAASPVGLKLRLHGLNLLGVERGAAVQLVTARASLDPARGPLDGIRHTGVVWQGVPVPSIPQPVPQVLVSLSTNAFAGQHQTLQSVLDAVADLPIEVIATAGPALEVATLRIPANTRVHQWLDHDQVLATTSLVIGHGGHSTTMRALSFGVPVLVLPSTNFADQRAVGSALANAGAGMVMSRRAKIQAIQAAVQRMLEESRFREAAQVIGADIRRRDGAEEAADAIEEVVRARTAA